MKREDGPADITSGKHEDPVKAIKAELISTLSEQCRDCLLIGYLAEDLAELAVRQTVADMDNVHAEFSRLTEPNCPGPTEGSKGRGCRSSRLAHLWLRVMVGPA